MPDYQKGKIYKLWSPQGTEDEIYFGSTTDKLYKRKNQHKSKRNCKSSILFEKYDDVRIEVLEEYPCNNKNELIKKEGEYIRNNKCLNRNIPDRTIKEYRENNKDKITEYQKEYQQKWYKINKKKLTEQHKNWNEQNKEVVAEQKKIYYQNNKEEIVEKRKERYEKNKETLTEKVTCVCGCIFRKDGLIRHQKNNKHIKLMEKLNNN